MSAETSRGAVPLPNDDGASAQLELYSQAAHEASATVIHRYSTSFGLATRLLAPSLRPGVHDVYALVRVADEIVDGAGAAAGLDVDALRTHLDDLERETERAMHCGYSANLVVHAFARTARGSGITAELTEPFFASMRRDLSPLSFVTEQELAEYIYGSAEVVGLMCLRVFLREEHPDDARRERLEQGARRLGSAFQKVNFLRDLATDYVELGRSYFPGIEPGQLTELQKSALVADIGADLAAAGAVIPELPSGARRAVAAAHRLFSELNDRVAATPAAQLLNTRVRVPGVRKALIAASVWSPRS